MNYRVFVVSFFLVVLLAPALMFADGVDDAVDTMPAGPVPVLPVADDSTGSSELDALYAEKSNAHILFYSGIAGAGAGVLLVAISPLSPVGPVLASVGAAALIGSVVWIGDVNERISVAEGKVDMAVGFSPGGVEVAVRW